MMKPHAEPGKYSPKWTLVRALAAFGIIVLVCAALILLFGNFILNVFVRARIEKAFAAAHPGQSLRIGPVDCSLRKGRLAAQSLRLTTPDASFETGPITILHADWAPLLWGKPALPQVFAQARLEAANLAFRFSNPRYELRCARLEASVPAASLRAESISLRPQLGDEEFFAARPFRATRFRTVVPECQVVGLSYPELLAGTAYRANSIHVSGLELEALVNRDKPANLAQAPVATIHEALAALGKPIALNILALTDCTVKYCERRAAGTPPGILTFGSVQLSAKGLDTRAAPSAPMSIQARGNLMNAANLKVTMSVPIASPDLSLSYSGSLGAMDLTRLNAFLEHAERIRITSGWAESVAYDVQVKAGRATGRLRPVYRDLAIAFLDPQTGSEKGVVNRSESFLANLLTIRKSNLPDLSGSVRMGKVNYERKPDDSLLQLIWFALRSGVLDGIHP